MADFVVKYDGGVQMPSQSIKIYGKSLKCNKLIARDAETILFSIICTKRTSKVPVNIFAGICGTSTLWVECPMVLSDHNVEEL